MAEPRDITREAATWNEFRSQMRGLGYSLADLGRIWREKGGASGVPGNSARLAPPHQTRPTAAPQVGHTGADLFAPSSAQYDEPLPEHIIAMLAEVREIAYAAAIPLIEPTYRAQLRQILESAEDKLVLSTPAGGYAVAFFRQGRGDLGSWLPRGAPVGYNSLREIAVTVHFPGGSSEKSPYWPPFVKDGVFDRWLVNAEILLEVRFGSRFWVDVSGERWAYSSPRRGGSVVIFRLQRSSPASPPAIAAATRHYLGRNRIDPRVLLAKLRRHLNSNGELLVRLRNCGGKFRKAVRRLAIDGDDAFAPSKLMSCGEWMTLSMRGPKELSGGNPHMSLFPPPLNFPPARLIEALERIVAGDVRTGVQSELTP